jgi:choline dehydrogenase-like flavoprotein
MNKWDYPIDATDTPIQPSLYNAVGGSTIHWGAHFPRMKPSDFRVFSQDGVALDWPISYFELAEYFEINDQMMGVSGLAGDPAYPPRGAREFPPLPIGLGAKKISQAYERLGYHWWPVDSAIINGQKGTRKSCNNCGPCDLGCPRGSRASVDLAYWPEAIAAGAQLITEATVTKIISNKNEVSGVLYRDAAGQQHQLTARNVVLAGNGIGTARLLLLSANEHYDSGLANNSDQVGRNLMHHPTGLVTGIFDEYLDGFKGPFAVSIYSQEFYETDTSRGFVRGYQAQTIRSDGPLGTASGGYTKPVKWGRNHHEDFYQQFGKTASITVTTEDLPTPDNRVTLSSQVDRHGFKIPKLTYQVDENARKILDFGIKTNTNVLMEAGAREVITTPLVGSAGFHLMGTARMGDDPSNSVVDAVCRSHDLSNLWIVDGSVFVTAGALNPTSTIQAIALRAADAMLERALLPAMDENSALAQQQVGL